MASKRPKKIAIDNDDYHAKHIGRTEDKKLFFLTAPFEPAIGETKGNEFIALFFFDKRGNFKDSIIEEFGPRGTYDESAREERYNQILASLGKVKYCRVVIKPFSVRRFNIDFGLIIRGPEDDNDVYAVELLPGNYMAFFEPWDSGEYDT